MPFEWSVWLFLALAALLAGLVRGFAGFGPAMVFMPLASITIEPWRAVVMLFFLEIVLPLPMLPRALRHCVWREVAPLTLGAALIFPIGAYFLVSIDQTALRWVLSGLALTAVAALASGWRYHRAPTPLLSAAVGGCSGGLGGLAGFYGPPIALFWLGGQGSGSIVRANILVYLAVIGLIAGLCYGAFGLLRLSVAWDALAVAPLYALGLFLGARFFGFASEPTFRRIACGLIAGAAILGLPIL